jgi:hypothetical protein
LAELVDSLQQVRPRKLHVPRIDAQQYQAWDSPSATKNQLTEILVDCKKQAPFPRTPSPSQVAALI